jgi:DNA-binding SARP family transcriptional activator/tetratricopeptide (TPR) repeat protein
MQIEIVLLGTFEVVVDGRPVAADAWERRQAATLVKLLALAPGHRLHREQCIDAVWPEVALDDAAPRLHKAAHYARKATGCRDAVVLRRDTVSLFPDHDTAVDVVVFETLAQDALTRPDRDAARTDAVARALDRYTGPLLPGDPYEEWAVERRAHVRNLYLDLLRGAQRWTDLLAEEPSDERAHIAVMRELADRGDAQAALRQYERMDRALGRELGVAPGPEAIRLRDDIVASLDVATTDAPAAAATDLIGRDDELHLLTTQLLEAGAGHGRTVVLEGPAGIGKSALVHALRQRALALGWRVGAGGAAAIEGAWPYAPVLEAFADLGRRHPTLLDGLDDTFRDEIDRARSGAGDPAEDAWEPGRHTGHQRLFVAALELTRLAAGGQGLLLVVDDLHDADDATLRLLHFLARACTGERVLFLLARRPSLPGHDGEQPDVDRMLTSLQRRGALEVVVVAPLARDAVDDLVRRTTPGAPPDVLERAWAASGGVPFTAIEATRHPELPLGVESFGVPAATIDALQQVAVSGMTFDTDEFVALTGLDDDRAYAHLTTALSARVVERADSGYRFRHALVRDALIDRFAPHDLRRAHGITAARLEHLGASPARVGHHLLRAGDPAAVDYLLRAAETEIALGAYKDALDLVDAVLAQASADHHARVHSLRGDAYFAMADPRAVDAYRVALETVDGGASRLLRAKLARALVSAGDLAAAGEVLEGIEPDGGTDDGAVMLAKALYAYFSGDIDTAAMLADRARDVVGTDAENWQVLDLVSLQGLIAHNEGRWFEQLRVEVRRTGTSTTLATAVFDGHLCVAEYLLYGPTPYREVLELTRGLRATARRAGALRGVAFAAMLEGEAALLAGDIDRAERELQEAVDLHREIGAAAGEAHSLQRLAELRLVQGDRTEAHALLRQALPRARWSPIALHLLQRIYGTLIAAAPTPEDARAVVDEATAALGPDDFCTFCQVMFAIPATIACARVGDVDSAREHLRVAETSAALWHGTAWQAALQEAQAYVAQALGDDAEARRLLTGAAGTFERSGQPLDAARCRSGLAAAAST